MRRGRGPGLGWMLERRRRRSSEGGRGGEAAERRRDEVARFEEHCFRPLPIFPSSSEEKDAGLRDRAPRYRLHAAPWARGLVVLATVCTRGC